ncbi:MAG: thiol-disulfide oxidoreductase DCC family protein [Rubricella sp.]
MTDQNTAAEVFYDGACPICSREIAMWKGARGMDDVAFRDIAEEDLPEGFDRETLLARFHVRRESGEVVAGAAAFLALWRRSPWFRPLAILLDRQPFLWMLDRAYDGFLRVRRLWR